MTLRIWRWTGAAFLISALIAGCQTMPGEPGQTRAHKPSTSHTDQPLEWLQRNLGGIESFHANGHVTIAASQGKQRLRCDLWFKQPDSYFIRGRHPLRGRVFDLESHGGQWRLWNSEEQRLYGPNSPVQNPEMAAIIDAVADLSNIPLIVNWTSPQIGNSFQIMATKPSFVAIQAKYGSKKLSGKVYFTQHFEARNSRFEWFSKNKYLLARIICTDYRMTNTYSVPYTLLIQVPSIGQESYIALDLRNIELDPEAFPSLSTGQNE